MRIAVLSRYNGVVNRGVESWSVNLCEHLQQLGHSCLLIQGGTAVPEGTSFRTVSLNVALPAASDRVFRGPASKVVERCYMSTGERDLARFVARALPHLIAFRPDI